MKNNFFRFSVLVAGTMLLLSSCDKKENELQINNNSSVEFVASMPTIGLDAIDTKTTTTDGKRVLWCNEDHISIFRGRNVNEEYKVKDGFGGKTTTTFTKVNDDDFSAGSGDPFDANIAYYPYGNIEYIGSNGNHALSVNIPSIQTYVKSSFGDGALPMVAVTSSKNDNALDFKNIFGFLKLQFKSADGELLIKSITIKGNNNEKLNGAATIYCSAESAPAIVFIENAGNSITLECNDTAINETTATDFWFALPPITFTKGITVEIATSATTMVKKTSASLTITRSRVKPMQVLTIKAEAEDKELDIPDANFKKYLLEHCDMNGDGRLTLSDAEKWNSSESNKKFNISNQNISSLKGIEYFTTLTSLYCSGNQLTTLDVSNNTALTELYCVKNQLSTLNLGSNTALTSLNCSKNQLTTLIVNHNTSLKELRCSDNKLTTLDLSNNTVLTLLWCGDNQFSTLDISNNTALENLSCDNSKLTSLDISNNTALSNLTCSNNQLTVLDVCNNTNLESLMCDRNQLTTLDISNTTALKGLYCHRNQLTIIDISNNTALVELYCSNNPLYFLDLSKNTALTWLVCENTALTELNCSNTQLKTLKASNNTALTKLNCEKNKLTTLNVSNNTAMTELRCSNNQLTTLNLSSNTTLTTLYCDNNKLTSLNINNNTVLTELGCSRNQLTSLDVSKNTALATLSCGYNQLTTLDINSNTALTSLSCRNNKLTTLDVSNNTALEMLICRDNQLTTLDLRKNANVTMLYCSMESLKTLYLKKGHEINRITNNRSTSNINENTEIVFVD